MKNPLRPLRATAHRVRLVLEPAGLSAATTTGDDLRGRRWTLVGQGRVVVVPRPRGPARNVRRLA